MIIGKEKMPYNMHKMTNDTHSHLQKKAKVYIKKQKDNEKIYIIHNITLTLL